MAKEELIQFEGLVTEILPDARYRVHGFSRDAIEKAIDAEGFQLWRLREKEKAQA